MRRGSAYARHGVGSRTTLAVGIVLGAGLASMVAGCDTSGDSETVSLDPSGRLEGRVVDPDGRPLSGVAVRVDSSRTTTDTEGLFALPVAAGPHTVIAGSGTRQTTAVVPGATAGDVVLRQTPASVVSLRFGGDVMAGRRFYDLDDDGDPRDGVLPQHAGVAEHVSLLHGVADVLADADLTVVNLETPLLANPWTDPTEPRPTRLNQEKPYAFASSPTLARALGQSGVDVVDLGNNHVRDAGDIGLAATIRALDAAGLAHFGAGESVRQAWKPAVLQVRDRDVAFLGCTTITGLEHLESYVAGQGHGGAARCQTGRLARAVRSAGKVADTVVVLIHGGNEYERSPTAVASGYSRLAAAAGATLVVNGHPHVVGGVKRVGRSVVVASMGNLLFDQDVWPTALGYLLRAEVNGGEVVGMSADPFFIESYTPAMTVGALAQAAARQAAAGPDNPLVLDGTRAVFGGQGWRQQRRTVAAPPAVTTTGTRPPVQLAEGWWVARGQSDVRVGSDLLWTGSFENEDVDASTAGALMWDLLASSHIEPSAACTGALGVAVSRSSGDTDDAVLTPRQRQLVHAGTPVTLYASFRDLTVASGATPPAAGALELHWYSDTTGTSFAVTSTRLPDPAMRGCQVVRVDAVVPDGAVAAQPFVRLQSPRTGTATIGVDDVRLVAWGRPRAGGRFWDTVEMSERQGSSPARPGRRASSIQVVADVPPGGRPPDGPWEER